jgi:tetratricopeptide (TPR) repeat protein
LSLLLDALKRAEQEKRARGPAESAPPILPAREPAIARPAPAAANLELQPLGSGGPAHGGASRPDSGMHAAQAVFQAKAAAPEPRSRGMVWATIGAVAVVAIAAGAYVWYSVSALTPPVAIQQRPRPAPIPPLPGAPAMQLPAAEMALASSAAAKAASEPAPRVAVLAPAAPPAAAPIAPPPAQDPVERLLRESAALPAAAPLRLDRSADAPRQVPAQVASAYQALRQGKLADARRGYEAALATDPMNVDARLGLATIEARSGNRTSAADHYRRAVESDPRNATALAGLAALADFSRPEALEAQLRGDLARNPDSAALRFTLGNLYTAQSRWQEAQGEYFEAHRLDPGNADVLYNLAVALDHLGQSRVAAGFYQRALEAARDQGAQFDPAPVARRLAEIR